MRQICHVLWPLHSWCWEPASNAAPAICLQVDSTAAQLEPLSAEVATLHTTTRQQERELLSETNTTSALRRQLHEKESAVRVLKSELLHEKDARTLQEQVLQSFSQDIFQVGFSLTGLH